MIKVLVNKKGGEQYIPLTEFVEQFRQTPPPGWYEYIEEFVNPGMSIDSTEVYLVYLKKLNLRYYDYYAVKVLYNSLTIAYGTMLDDDILRYIAHIYGLGYFERIKYTIDIHKPNLDQWLATDSVFKSLYVRSILKEEERFSMMDLLPLEYGMNAIRWELLWSSKW